VVRGAPFRNQLNRESHLYTHSVRLAQPTLSSRRYCGGVGDHCVDDVRDLEISTMASRGSGSLFHLGFHSDRFASSDYVSQLEITLRVEHELLIFGLDFLKEYPTNVEIC